MTMAHQDTDETGPETGGRDEVFVGSQPARELPADVARLVRFMEPELDLEDVCLEVPCGAGVVSRALSHRVRHITAMDTAEDLLDEGKHAADRAATTNVTFTRGDASYLPFLPRSFTLVLSGFLLHRVGDPAAVLRRLTKVCRPGAGLIVADIVRPVDGSERAAGDLDLDRIERLRDPEHVRVLSLEEITSLIAEAGAEVKRSETFEVVQPVEAWLAAIHAAGGTGEQIRAELAAELDGGPPTGLRPSYVDGALHVTHVHGHLMAVAA